MRRIISQLHSDAVHSRKGVRLNGIRACLNILLMNGRNPLFGWFRFAISRRDRSSLHSAVHNMYRKARQTAYIPEVIKWFSIIPAPP